MGPSGQGHFSHFFWSLNYLPRVTKIGNQMCVWQGGTFWELFTEVLVNIAGKQKYSKFIWKNSTDLEIS